MSGTFDDHRIEVFIGNLLRAGMITAATVVVLGAGIYLWQRALQPADFHVIAEGVSRRYPVARR